MKKIFLIFTVLFGVLHTKTHSNEPSLVVHTDIANYDGEKCILTGHVTLEHEMGTLSANRVVMIPAEGSNNVKPVSLQMQENVLFALKDGGELRCAQATIDCQSLYGTFQGDEKNTHVIYKDEGNKLAVKGRLMGMAVGKKAESQVKSNIREITVTHDVMISYAEEFLAYGDQATYRQLAAGMGPASILPGIITLHMLSPTEQCRVLTHRGDDIQAEEISLDTNARQLDCRRPSGYLSVQDPNQEPFHFSANRLLWNEPEQLLSLKGNVKVTQGSLGNLEAVEQVKIQRKVTQEQKALSSIETNGKATLSYMNEDKNKDHSLTCYGTIKVDHIKMEARLYSPKNPLGKVEEAQQLHFDDIKGEIFADKALITYQLANSEIIPSKIILGGNVRILNTLTRHENGTTTALQYALADQVEIIPSTNEMLFKSNSGRRVLFFDKANNLQVSAPALKIVREVGGAGKETIQGYGDVRFSFIENELNQLRKRFEAMYVK